MATIYRTSDADVLDRICYQYYGTEGMTAEVLSANPNLAEYGAILPSGIEITMPELVIRADAVVSLWD